MKFSKYVLTAVVASGLSFSAIAEEQAPLIVTATRTAQTVDDSLASVTVITAKQIEQQQAHDLLGLLNALSGIDMTNNGGMGKATSLFMRGTSSAHVLVMIDGIKVGSATTGSVAFQHIPVSQIERIEIVRGPRSSLYGSEAIGGVIQIFTKKGPQQQHNVEVGFGTHATQSVTAGASGKLGNTSYSINVNQFSTDGITVKSDKELDNDGYTNNSVSLALSQQFSNTSSLDLNLMQASGHTEYDGFYNNSDFVQQTTGLQYSFAANEILNIKLSASQSLDQSDNFADTVFKTKYNTTQDNLSWQNDIIISDNQLFTLGLDYQKDSVVSTTKYDESSRKNTAFFVQHQWNGEENDLQIALRNDDNEAFGTHTTGNIAWGHNFANKLRLITSYGTAFNAPTFNQLYFPGYGNSELKPETSATTEVELRKEHSWGKTSLSVYQTNINDLIAGFPVSNVNKAEIKGVELRIDTKVLGWDTQLEIAALDPRDKETNYILRRRSQSSMKLNMDKNYGKWTSGFSIISQGHRYDDAKNEEKINGYTLINLRTTYAVSKELSIKAKVENLLDKKYETALDYNNPGLTAFVALKYQGF